MTVSKPPVAGDAEKNGFVRCRIRNGEVFLLGPLDLPFRLEFKGDGDEDWRRALPVGTYKVMGYRIERKDSDGVSWFISTTSHGFKKIRIRKGEETRLEIDPRIHFTVRSMPHGKTIDGTMSVTGKPKVGLSIYKSGKRIPIGYRFLDADGKTVATGNMRYG